jgi:hypothetical protein
MNTDVPSSEAVAGPSRRRLVSKDNLEIIANLIDFGSRSRCRPLLHVLDLRATL